MKKLRITVSGKVYDVEVQILQDDEAIGSPASLPYPGAAALPIPEAARPASAPAPVPGGAGDPNVIASPLAGTVQKVFVTKGMPVEAKTPLVLLDAMKMDTYIHAPRTGHVAEVCVAPGDVVQVGTVLIRYRTEG